MQLEKIEDLVRSVLAKEFNDNPAKQIIYKAGTRLNFSCPYCGDSKDGRKKRGNFYLDTLAYKCYNGGCGIYKDAISFFMDYSLYSKFNSAEKEEMSNVITETKTKRRTIYGNVDITYFFDRDVTEFMVDRDKFMNKLKLQEVWGSAIQRYVQRRYQKIDNRFAWDPKYERLFIFNLNSDGTKILGLQLRNMNSVKGSAKYLTYKLSGIYEKLLHVKDQEFLDNARMVDPIASVFGIGSLDFSRDITIFEGPLDSFLWPNSVGLCSIENKFPFDVENTRYWYDWDKAGILKSMDLLSKGKTVFNWGKFLEENDLTKNRKWDLNDLVIHLRKTGKKIKRFDNYFTDDALDLGYFIVS